MSLDGIWLPLITKMVATAILVVGALKAAERSGPFWGALFIALPVSVGPTYVILALDHDAHFLAASALDSLAANAAIGLFLISYARLGARYGLAVNLVGAIAVWLVGALLVASTRWTVSAAAAANLLVFGLGAWFTRDLINAPKPLAIGASRWFEAPARGLLVGLLVASVTTASYAIGPSATGVIAMFPIASASLAIILHRRHGGAAVAPVMASALRTVPSLACGLLVMTLTVEPWGKTPSLIAALVISLAWALALVLARTWKRRTIPAAVTSEA